MLCKDVIKVIQDAYPEEYALEWDNVGLLAGRDDKEIRRIYVALDADDEAVEAAVRSGADLLVTHHPLIFSGLKRINNQDFIGARLLKLIRNDISYYAMHTNYDVLGMGQLSAQKMSWKDSEILEVTKEDGHPEGIGRTASLQEPVSVRELCGVVKERFGLEAVKVFGDPDRKVQRVAISPGSGKSMIGPALEKKADVLITGDIDHHTGIDAVARNLAVIDAGHYGIEHIFIEDMKKFLEGKLDQVEVIAAPVRHPFHIL